MAYHSSIEREPVNWKSGYLHSLNKKYSEHFAGWIDDARKNWRKFRNHKRKTLRTHRKGCSCTTIWVHTDMTCPCDRKHKIQLEIKE